MLKGTLGEIMYGTIIIDNSLPHAWERAMRFVGESPEIFTFGGGSEVKHAVDSQTDFILTHNAVAEAIAGMYHPGDPFCSPQKNKAYRKEYTAEFDPSAFDYTYYNLLVEGFKRYKPAEGLKNRIVKKLFGLDTYTTSNIDQIAILRDGLEKQIDEQLQSNRNVAVLFNPAVDNFSGNTIPCFNEILVRWEGGTRCSVHTLFRSHDLGTAWNSNMITASWFVNREIAKPCGCTINSWDEKNFSLHIYNYDLPIIDTMPLVLRNPKLQVMQDKLMYNSLDDAQVNHVAVNGWS